MRRRYTIYRFPTWERLQQIDREKTPREPGVQRVDILRGSAECDFSLARDYSNDVGLLVTNASHESEDIGSYQDVQVCDPIDIADSLPPRCEYDIDRSSMPLSYELLKEATSTQNVNLEKGPLSRKSHRSRSIRLLPPTLELTHIKKFKSLPPGSVANMLCIITDVQSQQHNGSSTKQVGGGSYTFTNITVADLSADLIFNGDDVDGHRIKRRQKSGTAVWLSITLWEYASNWVTSDPNGSHPESARRGDIVVLTGIQSQLYRNHVCGRSAIVRSSEDSPLFLRPFILHRILTVAPDGTPQANFERIHPPNDPALEIKIDSLVAWAKREMVFGTGRAGTLPRDGRGSLSNIPFEMALDHRKTTKKEQGMEHTQEFDNFEDLLLCGYTGTAVVNVYVASLADSLDANPVGTFCVHCGREIISDHNGIYHHSSELCSAKVVPDQKPVLEWQFRPFPIVLSHTPSGNDGTVVATVLSAAASNLFWTVPAVFATNVKSSHWYGKHVSDVLRTLRRFVMAKVKLRITMEYAEDNLWVSRRNFWILDIL